MCVQISVIVTVSNIILISNDVLHDVHIDSFPMYSMLRIYETFNILLLMFLSPQFHSYELGNWFIYLLLNKNCNSISLKMKCSLISELFLYPFPTKIG